MASWGEAKDSRLIGKRVTRLSGVEKATGRAKYTFDIKRPWNALRSHFAVTCCTCDHHEHRPQCGRGAARRQSSYPVN